MSTALSKASAAASRLRKRKEAEQPPVDLLAHLFPQSRAFAADEAPLKFAFCTRRAAKSYSTGSEHVNCALTCGRKHLIVGLTRESVRGAFWDDVLKALDARHDLGLSFNETRLELRTPRGGTIRLLGMDSNEKERRKALGQKYCKVAIDEAQDFSTDLEQLVYSVFKPAVADYEGSISLTGTPANLLKGFFYNLTTGKVPGWSPHKWTTFDNPHMIRQWTAEIERLKAANPRVVEVPWFRQNYLGEWVIEKNKIVYAYESPLNDFRELPIYAKGEWHFVLGCDLGWADPTAWVVMAYHDHDPALYMLEADKESGLDITAVVARTKKYQARYDFSAMVIDNANKQAVEEMKKRHGLPWIAADKTGKSDFIGIMNGEFILGNIKLHEKCAPLKEEYATLIWDDKSDKREEHPASPNHCADASLYGWRYCFQFLSERLKVRPKAGTPEAQALDAEEMEALQERLYREQNEDPWATY